MADYTAIDDPSAYFQTTLYSGTGSEQSITNTGNSDLQPDWVWLKVRSNGTYGHALFDSVRGVNKVIGLVSEFCKYSFILDKLEFAIPVS